MKRIISVIISALICGAVFTSCDSDMEELATPADSGKLHLWWRHAFQSDLGSGRGYIFSFTTIERFENNYELVFGYQINNNRRTIEIRLIDKINRGKCPVIPPAWDGSDGFCPAGGTIFISERLLINGEYELIVKTASFTVQSEFIITEEAATLNIPDNNYLSSEWQGNEIPITPKNLIYGGVSIGGSENKRFAFDFFENGKALGILRNTNHTLQALPDWVDENGNPIVVNMWGGSYHIQFLYSVTDFSDVVELAKRHLNKNAIQSIWFYSTNGDKATLCRERGISISLAK